MEYWWDITIKTATKIPHNKPDNHLEPRNSCLYCRRLQLPIRLEHYKVNFR